MSELEEQTRLASERLGFVEAEKRFLILVNNVGKLEAGLDWLKSHALHFSDASVVLRAEELSTPIVLKMSESDTETCPPFLQSVHNILKTAAPASSLPSLTLYAIPPLELTTTAVSLLHSDVDVVFIIGCRVLSRGQYENVEEFQPLVEEIILKEAIQPVILYK